MRNRSGILRNVLLFAIINASIIQAFQRKSFHKPWRMMSCYSQRSSCCFSFSSFGFASGTCVASPSSSRFYAKKEPGSKKKKGGSSASGGGSVSSMRGFGALAKKPSGSSSSASNEYQVLTDPDILELVRWLENSGASISGLAVARFPNKDNLRGVVALKPFKKGDVLLSIPEALTINWSGSDRLEESGFHLLQTIQKSASEGSKKGLQAYIRLLPRIGGDQFATTTDFFTEEELTMLQWPPVQEETTKRLASTKAQAESSNTPIEDLKWAIWLIVSRVIAIATRDSEGVVRTRKLLIPFLDFLNHDGKGAHQLSAKNGKDGLMLRVVAGADVAEGDEITFAYGAGGLGGDRFVQDYGFLPPSSDPALEKANRQAIKSQKPAVLEALRATTLDEDRALLTNKTLTPNQALAVQFRIGLKEAL